MGQVVCVRNSWHEVIDASPLPMFAAEAEGHVIVWANPAFCLLCGQPEEALLGRPASEALGECRGLDDLLDRVRRTRDAEVAAGIGRASPGGNPARWSCAAWFVPGDIADAGRILVHVWDASDAAAGRPEGEDAALREVNQALMISSVRQHEMAEQAREAQERTLQSADLNRQSAVLEERNRIAREIHDTLAQTFVGILLKLRVAERIADQRPAEARALIDHVRDLAQEGLAQARRSVWALQPDADEYRDVLEALRRVTDRVAASADVRAEVYVQGTPRDLPPDVGMGLARIGEEAMTNALRHGQATMLVVDLTFGADHVSLRIQDNGSGFDPAREDSGGFGLISMQQRADRLGGQMAIVSQPGLGAEVSVTVPIGTAMGDAQLP